MVLARLDQEFLTSFGENAFGGDICTVSEFRNKGDWNLCDKFYTYFNNETFEQFYSGEVEDDIIHRDRLLRSYPKEHSVKMLRSMHNALIDFYDYYEPDVCVAKNTDNYVADLAFKICKERHINICSIGASIINNKSRFHTRGEHVPTEEPSDDLIRTTIREMSDKSFRPNFYIYNKQTLGSHIKMALRHSAGRMVYRIKSVKENDPLGFHYRSTLRSTTKLKLINYRSNFIFDKDWKAKLKKDHQKHFIYATPFHP